MDQPAAHRSIVIVDVENFGDPARTNAHQLAIRDGMYKALRQSFARARISWRTCVIEDRGDGVLILVRPEVPKSWLVARLPVRLAAALAQHNATCPVKERIRLRMALDAGEVHRDTHGYTGTSLNRAFRLVEAPVARTTLHGTSGAVALIVSGWFYDEVVQHHAAAEPSRFRQVRVVIKETDTVAWIRVIESGDALSRPNNGQLVPTSAGLPEGSQPAVFWPGANAVAVRDHGLEHLPGAWITRYPEGAEFTVHAPDAEAVDLCLVDDGGNEQRRIALSKLPFTKGTWHVHFSGLSAGQRYGYRVSGQFTPSSGHRFNPYKLLLDPYAKAITGTVNWAGPVFGYLLSSDTVPDPGDSASYVPHSVVVDDAFDWGDDKHPNIPWVDTVIYEAHVRGFTRLHPLVPEEQRGTYAGMSSAPVIEYLHDLGITTLQLMPVHHYVSEYQLIQRGLTNYWGYNTIGFFAPEAKYSSSGTVGEQVHEFKAMVRELHKAGIEVILDVDFNHTSEGDHRGPHLCFRGMGNRTYYRSEHHQSRYKDYADFGNSFNVADPQVLAFLVDSLRYWVTEMHVDGFRIDLASALAGHLYEAGCLNTFFDLIRNDTAIPRVKLIAESWDLGESGGYQVDEFPSRWAEFNDRYRDAVCYFWRGSAQPLEELAHRLTGSIDLCGLNGPGPDTSVNFIACHDGLTLNDLVSYNNKHNENNGEDNRDGIDFNNSWNCGAEGPTSDMKIRELRERQKRNFLTTLLLSAGVPTLQAGDELGRTQGGNNNPYCHDSEITWVDWAPYERGDPLLQFTKDLIALRAKYRIFRRRKPFRGSVIRNTGIKDVTWFTADGTEMKEENWATQNTSAFGMFLNGQAVFNRSIQSERKGNDSFLLLLNGGSETIRFALPGLPWAASYVPIINTGDFLACADTATASALEAGAAIPMKARSIVVLKTRADR